jgi:Domain of unknown function (DUF4190)
VGLPDQPRPSSSAAQPGPVQDGPVPPGQAYAPAPRALPGRTNGLAIAALVTALAQFLLWFFLLVPGFIAALLAFIFGLAGLAQTRARGEGGKGMAITGIVLGGLGVLAGIAWAILLGVGSTHFHYHSGT